MKKWHLVLVVIGIICLWNGSASFDVWADARMGKATLQNEDRYDPKYYQPLDLQNGQMTGRDGAARDIQELEEVIVSGLKAREAEIDVSEYGLEFEEFFVDYIRILNNHVELFYVDWDFEYYFLPIGDSEIVLSVLPSYLMDEESERRTFEQMNIAAAEALALVSEDMEDYEKALVVHDWLAQNCAYDYENYMLDNGIGEYVPDSSHQAYGALAYQTAVCDGYAKAYRYLMYDKLGIACYVTSSAQISHAWNMIEIDGVFYHVDVTWDDPAWDRIGYAQHDNFLLSDKGIIETGHEGWDIGIMAYDASFEDALWQDSIGGAVFYEGYWYYVDSLKGILFKTDCMLDGETEVVYAFDYWASTDDMVWEYSFSFPQIFRDKLIFNGPKKIYCMPFDTEEVAELAEPWEMPEDTETEVYNIFGFEIVGDDMGYVICSDAFPEGSFSEFTEYEELPFEKIVGSVSLEGEERYDSELLARVELEYGSPEGLLYSWYRNGERILGANEKTYRLKASDIGKIISVEAVHKDCIGKLNARTKTVQKALLEIPAEMQKYKGALNKKLSSIPLKSGYHWKEPERVLNKLGDFTYPIIYCPDSALYEPLEVSASVHVDCVSHKWGNRKTLKKASCSIKGMEQYTCAYCGITNNKQIAATGKHSFDKGEVKKKPTYQAKGLKVFTCTVCKKQKQEDIAALIPPQKGTKIVQDNIIYRILSPGVSGGTVEAAGEVKDKKKIRIPSEITEDNITYRVVSIRKGAFQKKKKLTEAIIGSSVKTIGKNAFSGSKKLKKIKLQTEKLSKVEKNALKGISKHAVIQCPKKKIKSYQKLFGKKTGFMKQMNIKKL